MAKPCAAANLPPCGGDVRQDRGGRDKARHTLTTNAAPPSTGLTVRPGRVDDADSIHAAILGIGETVGSAHKITSTPDDLRRDGFGPNPRFQTLIAEVDGAFAGLCLSFPIYSTWMGKPGAYVQDLFVAKDYRGLGVGEKLLRRLARELRSAGGVYVELAVDTGNFAAQRFYERVGITHHADDQVHRILGEAFAVFADSDDAGPA